MICAGRLQNLNRLVTQYKSYVEPVVGNCEARRPGIHPTRVNGRALTLSVPDVCLSTGFRFHRVDPLDGYEGTYRLSDCTVESTVRRKASPCISIGGDPNLFGDPSVP